MRLIFLVTLCFILCFTRCKISHPSIEYTYISEVEYQLKLALATLRESYLVPEKGEKEEIFVKMMYCGTTTSMIFNFLVNVPPSIQAQIRRSNRYLVIDEIKIPVLLDLDDGNALIRELGVNHGILGGYLIEFDARGNEITSGMVY